MKKRNDNIPTVEIDYDPHPGQLEIHKSPSRFRVVVCGRKFGKTHMAVAELISNALFKAPGSTNWYVSPTYRQSKNVAWRKKLLKMLPPQLIVTRHEHELSVTLDNGSIIELKGADNPDSLRGVDVDLVVLDEYAFMKPFVWEEIIRPNLTATAGEAIFIGTPNGYDHFYDVYMMGQKDSENYDSDYASFKQPSTINPYLPIGEVEKAQKELTEDAFAQEYLADFRHFTGRVFKEFDRNIHVIPPFKIPDHWILGRYMDRGWRVPTGVGYLAVDEHDSWYIFDEIYAPNLTNPELAEMIEQRSGNKYFWHSYADSAQASDLEDLADLGAYFMPVKKEPGEKVGEWIRMGIAKISERLRIVDGSKPKLFVFSNCINHIFEFENYIYEQKNNNLSGLTDRVQKKNDHLMDGLRYFACMYKTGTENLQNFSFKRRDFSFS